MDALAEHMIKQELSSSEEEGAVGDAKVKKPPEQTVESDPLPTFVNPPMTMENMMQMMMMMRQDEERRRQDEERRRREEKKEQEEKEEKRRRVTLFLEFFTVPFYSSLLPLGLSHC